MRKLKLNLETLDVQSFPTAAGEKAEKGTVLGHEPTRGMGPDCFSIAYPCVTGICDPTYECSSTCP